MTELRKVIFGKSDRNDKRLKAVFYDSNNKKIKTVHFGSNMAAYPDHKNE